MKLFPELLDWHQDMILWRRDFHQHPELAYEEVRTAARVESLLQSWGIPTWSGIGETGVVGIIEGYAPGRSIGLRADMDALPMEEKTGLEFQSQVPGCFHGCGHDGHTVMLLGAARYLASKRNFPGRVVLVFQPAEECFAGAKRMLDDGLLERFPIDEIYGLHNAPQINAGSVATRTGPIMAAFDHFTVTLTGRGGHASTPHNTVDPVIIACQVVNAWQTIISRQVPPLEAAVISTTQIHAGSAFNVTPDTAELKGSIRTFNAEVQNNIHQSLTELATSIASAYGALASVNIQTGYPPTINHPEATALMVDVAASVLGPENVDTNVLPRTGSEDFAFFLEQVPGCYFLLGQGAEGTRTGVHSSHYRFNDNILPVGSTLLAHIAERALSQL